MSLASGISAEGDWSLLPAEVLLEVFKLLCPCEVLRAGLTCKSWNHTSYDSLLWKFFFKKLYKLNKNATLLPGKTSWYQELKRITLCVPSESSTYIRHTNKVHHVCFSPCGDMFATCSEDGNALVWNLSGEVTHCGRVKTINETYFPLYAQFNKSGQLMVVSATKEASVTVCKSIILYQLFVGIKQKSAKIKCLRVLDMWNCFDAWLTDQMSITMIQTDQNYKLQQLIFKHAPKFRVWHSSGAWAQKVMVATFPDQPFPLPITSEDSKDSDGSRCEDSTEKNSKPKESTRGWCWRKKTPAVIALFAQTYSPLPHILELRMCNDFLNGRKNHLRLGEGKLLDFKAAIVGRALSPDQRYIYLNCRPWPENCLISDPTEPPPISSQLEIQVVDLHTFSRVENKVYREHLARSAADNIKDIHLSVSNEFVASGCEENHGYLWHVDYGCCLRLYPHEGMVRAVCFSPTDTSILVTVSDDRSVKIWRSRQHMASEAHN